MIPFVDLRAQHQAIRHELDAAIAAVLARADFVLGPEVEAFEEAFAEYCGVRHAVAVNSGTSALHLALLAAGVGPGDEVITVPFTFVATAIAIEMSGARPVFVDIHPETFTMDPARIPNVVTARTKAIIPVHLYGQPADMDPILEVARRHGLVVIEDAAQAHGAEYCGRRTGGLGQLGCFSFYPSKNLGACGEGGLVSTDDSALAREVRMLRDCGQDRKYHHVRRGFNYRLAGIQGAVLGVKLKYLDPWTRLRRTHAAHYGQALAGAGVGCPAEAPYARHVYHLFVVRTRARESLRDSLAAEGIQTGLHYPSPVHRQPAYADLGYPAGSFPASEQAAAEVVSLPMFPELTADQIGRVAAAIRAHASARG